MTHISGKGETVGLWIILGRRSLWSEVVKFRMILYATNLWKGKHGRWQIISHNTELCKGV